MAPEPGETGIENAAQAALAAEPAAPVRRSAPSTTQVQAEPLIGEEPALSDGALEAVLAAAAETDSANAMKLLEQAAKMPAAPGAPTAPALAQPQSQVAGSNTAENAQTPEPMPATPMGRVSVAPGSPAQGNDDNYASVVTSTIEARLGAIRGCYEYQLRTSPRLSGSIAVMFTVQLRGNVSDAAVHSNTTGSEALGSCVLDAVRRLRFNPGPDNRAVTFTYPFQFAPAS